MCRLKLFFLVFAACLWGSGINMAHAQSSKDANGAVKKEVKIGMCLTTCTQYLSSSLRKTITSNF